MKGLSQSTKVHSKRKCLPLKNWFNSNGCKFFNNFTVANRDFLSTLLKKNIILILGFFFSAQNFSSFETSKLCLSIKTVFGLNQFPSSEIKNWISKATAKAEPWQWCCKETQNFSFLLVNFWKLMHVKQILTWKIETVEQWKTLRLSEILLSIST